MGKNFVMGLVHSVAAIYVAGLLLDQASKGTFGAQLKMVAANVTNGYGKGN